MGDKMFGWHHWFNGHELGQTPGDGEGQGGLPCCSPWGHKELDMTWWLNNAILYKRFGWPLILASVGIPGTNLPWMLKGDYNLLSSSRHPGCPCVAAVNFRESRVSDQGLLRARLGNGTSNWKGQSRFKQWEKRLHFLIRGASKSHCKGGMVMGKGMIVAVFANHLSHADMVQSLSCVWLFLTPRTAGCQASLCMGFPRPEYQSGLPFLYLGIFLTQESNLCLPHRQANSLPLNHQGSPNFLLPSPVTHTILIALLCLQAGTVFIFIKLF